MGKRRLSQVIQEMDAAAGKDAKGKDAKGEESSKEEASPKKLESAAGGESSPARKGSDDDSSDDEPVEVKPIGQVIKVSSRGKSERKHYEAFELEGVRYDLEDSVLVTPEQKDEKPYVAIIKEIKEAKDGSIAVTGQWFYRPEEAKKKGGGAWSASDSRELFYSFHRDEVPAEAVMHKCVVHFIPPQKQLPLRSKYPGFIIRQVYDTVQKKLWKLTDKDYEDSKQKEIDLLVQKTRDALGELPNIEVPEVRHDSDAEELDVIKRHSRRRGLPPLNVSREDSNETVVKTDAPLSAKVDTPSSCMTPAGAFPSETMELLHSQNSLTGQASRDRWLEKILKTLKVVFDAEESRNHPKGLEIDLNVCQEVPSSDLAVEPELSKPEDGVTEENGKDGVKGEMKWPESAILAVTALEKVAHEVIGSDAHKYNLKMRQLEFNLKKSDVLARRLLKKELEPSTVFHMSPVELKDGITSAEKEARDPPKLQTLKMTDARCDICGKREVGVKDIIRAGFGDRYQLECMSCGNSWYASRDVVASLSTEDRVVHSPMVGLAPWATSKFESDKDLSSPREHNKPSETPAFKSVDKNGHWTTEAHRVEPQEKLLPADQGRSSPATSPSSREQNKQDNPIETKNLFEEGQT